MIVEFNGKSVEIDTAHTYAISVLRKGYYTDGLIEETVSRNVAGNSVSASVKYFEDQGITVARVWRELF